MSRDNKRIEYLDPFMRWYGYLHHSVEIACYVFILGLLIYGTYRWATLPEPEPVQSTAVRVLD